MILRRNSRIARRNNRNTCIATTTSVIASATATAI
jgi:hypothetical protein